MGRVKIVTRWGKMASCPTKLGSFVEEMTWEE